MLHYDPKSGAIRTTLRASALLKKNLRRPTGRVTSHNKGRSAENCNRRYDSEALYDNAGQRTQDPYLTVYNKFVVHVMFQSIDYRSAYRRQNVRLKLKKCFILSLNYDVRFVSINRFVYRLLFKYGKYLNSIIHVFVVKSTTTLLLEYN